MSFLSKKNSTDGDNAFIINDKFYKNENFILTGSLDNAGYVSLGRSHGILREGEGIKVLLEKIEKYSLSNGNLAIFDALKYIVEHNNSGKHLPGKIGNKYYSKPKDILKESRSILDTTPIIKSTKLVETERLEINTNLNAILSDMNTINPVDCGLGKIELIGELERALSNREPGDIIHPSDYVIPVRILDASIGLSKPISMESLGLLAA